MWRGVGAIVLVLALPGPASAIDQSGMEGTNCLMACDANGEHCRGNAPLSVRRIDSPADLTPGQTVRVEIDVNVGLQFLPTSVFGQPLTVRLHAVHDEVVDAYRATR